LNPNRLLVRQVQGSYETTLFAMISLLTGGFLSAQTPSPPPTSKIPPKIPVRDFFRNPVSRGY
jgi:hypothetical protein